MIDVSALPGPIPGAMYLAEPLPGEPYRVLLAADGFATHVKLLGTVEPDPVTGQVTVGIRRPSAGAAAGIRAAPVRLRARAARHADALRRPTRSKPNSCPGTPSSPPGTRSARSRSTPVPEGGHARRAPARSHRASRPAPSTTRRACTRRSASTLDREDGRTEPHRPHGPDASGLRRHAEGDSRTVRRPRSPCSRAPATRESPSRTRPPVRWRVQIGTRDYRRGSRQPPGLRSGKVYLAGPYKGAPLSLVAVVPAVSGPYDLGNVAVRAAIHVDPVTAQVTTVSDPLPQILEGIPLRTRSMIVDLDRPGFTFNPTNCAPFSIERHGLGGRRGQRAPIGHSRSRTAPTSISRRRWESSCAGRRSAAVTPPPARS